MVTKNRFIGIAKEDLKIGETIGWINIFTGKILCESIKFFPWGKIKLAREILKKSK